MVKPLKKNYKKRIVITGGTGLLGNYFYRKYKNFYKIIKYRYRIEKFKIFEKWLSKRRFIYFITIEYNTKKIVPNKGSAIFLHLTKNYRPTAGCVAISQNDFLILLKIINKKSIINIS